VPVLASLTVRASSFKGGFVTREERAGLARLIRADCCFETSLEKEGGEFRNQWYEVGGKPRVSPGLPLASHLLYAPHYVALDRFSDSVHQHVSLVFVSVCRCSEASVRVCLRFANG